MFRKSLRYLLGLFLTLSFSQNSIIAGGTCPTTIPPCQGFKTYTQGGWGSTPNGNNPGTFLQNNFAATFPTGLTIGCNNKIVLTTATAVRNFLPQGSTARTLNAGTLTNPTKSSYTNVLAGQLVAATLSVKFDRQVASFAPSNTNLGDLIISSGTFQGWTVDQLLNEANKFIGGCPSVSGKTATDYNTALTTINQSYDNGISSGNYLLCPILFNASAIPTTCYGGSNGSATISNISGGAGAPYSILWSTGAKTLTISNLTAGTYNFTITDAIGLTKTGSVTVNQPTQVIASAKAGIILCKGGTTTVTVTANGGTPPYTGTGSFTVTAGTYNYSVSDAKGCVATTSVTVTEPTLLTASSNAGTILCKGDSTTVIVAANGGTAPYVGTGSFKVAAGTHNYTVTDANGCTATTSVTVTEPTLLTASSNAGTILCKGDSTTVIVAANGGTAPYVGTGSFKVAAGTHNYTVTDANGCTATTSVTVTEPTLLTASSNAGTILCKGDSTTVIVAANGGTAPYVGTGSFKVAAGTHNYTVTDANGCTATTSVTVTEPTLLTASSNAGTILCKGDSTTVIVAANGGTAPYVGTGSFKVAAGTHNYTVTDANGCTATTSVTVTEPTLLTASSNAGTILCKGDSTTVIVAANGGTAPYAGTGSFKVAAGTHNYTVTDANGCTTTTSVTVTEPTLLTASSNAGTILCKGDSTTVIVAANGGTAPYAGTGSFKVAAGTHNYTVTDANGCTTTTSVTVTEPTLLTASSNAGTILCKGDSTTVIVAANGGTAPYAGTGSFKVAAGTHNYTVTDANGCTATTSVTVTEPTLLTISGNSTNDNSCNGGACSGTAIVTVNGGTAPYTYAWTNNSSTSNSAIGFCFNTSSTVSVTDANGCIITKSFTFTCTPNPCPPCDGYVTFTQGGWGSTPNGNNPGTILNNSFATAFPKGLTIGCTNQLFFTSAAAVRAFLPSGSNPSTLNGGTITNPTAASYKNVLAGQLVAATLSAEIDATINSFAPSTGKLKNLIINSGTFKNMSVAQVINEANLFIGGCASNYTASDLNTVLTAINQSWDNGISAGAANILGCPITLNKTISHNLCYNDQNGSITLSTCGGCGTYSYSWSNGASTASLTNLAAGMYIVTITDNCGLSKKDTTYITTPSQLVVTGSNTEDNSCNDGGDCSGTASVVVTGGTAPYTYSWTNGSTSSAINGLCNGSMDTVVILDNNGCPASYTFETICPAAGTCPPLVTFTQGGWGAAANGNNPGTYLNANFATAFQKGLEIGSGNTKITFTTAAAVQKVLPSGGTPSVLSITGSNPVSLNNVLAGQLIAATLNVEFDKYDANFAAPTHSLGKMYCNFAPFLCMTVDQVIAEANLSIAGLSTQFSLSDLNNALNLINLNYDNGLNDNGDLVCDDPCSFRGLNENDNEPTANVGRLSSGATTNRLFTIFPNPSNSNEVNLQFAATAAEQATVFVYGMNGQVQLQQNIQVVNGQNNVTLDISNLGAKGNLFMVQIILSNQTLIQSLSVTN